MSQFQRITSYFRRPKCAETTRETQLEPTVEDPALPPESSPFTELSQFLPSQATPPQSPDEPASQLKHSSFSSANASAKFDLLPEGSFQSAASAATSSSSQRMIKNGKEVVISSDGDDSDSIGSFESPEDLIMRFTTPKPPADTSKETGRESPGEGMALRPRKKKKPKSISQVNASVPVYKNTLEDLVMQAVDDNETEAGIAKLRARMNNGITSSGMDQKNKLHEGILATALDDDPNNGPGLQRLLDAVRRTEAFDLGKSWSFFDLERAIPPAPEFPRDCISPGTYIAVLREPESRERAFQSGIVDFALSREHLPDELVTWIFHSVPCESRDSLRHAYCRAFKHVTAERIESLIRPEDINTVFRQLGAHPEALEISQPIIPEAYPKHNSSQVQHTHQTALISVLEILCDASDLFSDDTRERIINILLRLTLDASLAHDSMLCSELERALTAVLGSISKGTTNELVDRICMTCHTTLKDAELQSRLLQHIMPTNDWIAALRRRLAMIFLTNDPLAVVGPQELELARIITILKDQRFDIKRHKRNAHAQYDYGELGAIISLLNIVIDSGWSAMRFPDKNTEKEFNSKVDILADRIKKIFTAIEDSGASHLKRTLAKEALESLHYRVVYSVRSKPPPKKVLFGEFESEHKTQNMLKYVKRNKMVTFSDETVP